MSNPYQNLIDRLRDLGIRSGEEAADVIELLTKQLANGPIAWVYEKEGLSKLWAANREEAMVQAGWSETPLYHIPIPEVKE